MFAIPTTTTSGYLLRLERGGSVLDEIAAFCRDRGVGAAWLTGLGAVEKVELGYYDLDARCYQRTRLDGSHELISLVGNVAQVDGAPFVHAHAALGDRDCRLRAGHLFAATVAATVELQLQPLTGAAVDRRLDPATGLKLLDLAPLDSRP
ncbi:MAG: DNA-binding protein [Deltaproteobacteria bacterium]|nr:DNA-binding protein [Deltaproteobacteria bacterium]